MEAIRTDDFHVDIVFDLDINNPSVWDDYQIVHFHRVIAGNYENTPNIVNYLKQRGIKTVMDLDDYLEGGNDEIHKQLREAYGHIPKPEARKIRNYLYGILEDAWKYNHDKRKGRRKKETK